MPMYLSSPVDVHNRGYFGPFFFEQKRNSVLDFSSFEGYMLICYAFEGMIR